MASTDKVFPCRVRSRYSDERTDREDTRRGVCRGLAGRSARVLDSSKSGARSSACGSQRHVQRAGKGYLPSVAVVGDYRAGSTRVVPRGRGDVTSQHCPSCNSQYCRQL